MTAAAPSGVVTFLFTDVEGSTRRWELTPMACGRRSPPMTRCCAVRSRRCVGIRPHRESQTSSCRRWRGDIPDITDQR